MRSLVIVAIYLAHIVSQEGSIDITGRFCHIRATLRDELALNTQEEQRVFFIDKFGCVKNVLKKLFDLTALHITKPKVLLYTTKAPIIILVQASGYFYLFVRALSERLVICIKLHNATTRSRVLRAIVYPHFSRYAGKLAGHRIGSYDISRWYSQREQHLYFTDEGIEGNAQSVNTIIAAAVDEAREKFGDEAMNQDYPPNFRYQSTW